MKKLLGIVVLGLLWCNTVFAGENEFTNKGVKINLPSEYELQKIGSSRSTDGSGSTTTGSSFYIQVKEGKTVGLLEIFNMGGALQSWYLPHAKKALLNKILAVAVVNLVQKNTSKF